MDGLKKFLLCLVACVIAIPVIIYREMHPSYNDMTKEQRRHYRESQQRNEEAEQHAREVLAQKREAERREKYQMERLDALSRYAAENPPPTSWPDRTDTRSFDFYLLVLSVHASYCADGHRDEPECKSAGAQRHALVLRGLWTEARDPGASPHDCSAPDPQLTHFVTDRLDEWMPGMKSGLHLKEWYEHGSCTGLSGDWYFSGAVGKTEYFSSVAEPQLRLGARRIVNVEDFRKSIERVNSNFPGAFTLHCRQIGGIKDAHGRPSLMEIRVCLDDDGQYKQPGTFLKCDSVGRHDEGCGKSFWIPGNSHLDK